MERERFVITYAARTASCTFLLDAEGICRRIVMNPASKRRDSARATARCVGAQYVASLDGAVAGCLVEMPRVGAAMLFARVDARGHVSLVRTGTVVQLETRSAEDPFDDVSVKTSAPEVAPAPARARVRRAMRTTEPDVYEGSDYAIRIRAAAGVDAGRMDPDGPTTSRCQLPEDERITLPVRTVMSRPREDAGPPAPCPRRSDPYMKAARGARPSSGRWAIGSQAATRRRRER